jgi:meso-butanediol dehydrogenase / (S,S)-butanediol dehydrogenase / diacetyl reductase
MRIGSVTQVRNEDWDDTLRVNLTGAFLLAKATVPHLIATGGSFVGISSIAAVQVPGESAAYAVSKAGLSMLVRTIARDFAADGVRANIVCPGWVRTEMADQEMAELGEAIGTDVEDAYRQVTALVPQARPGTADEVANAVVWLLGTESSYVNGSVITVDGGTTIVDVGTLPYNFAVMPRS